jgi:hypothetical protein
MELTTMAILEGETRSRSLWENEPSAEDKMMIDRLRALELMHVHDTVGIRLDAMATEMIAASRAGLPGVVAVVVGPTGAGKSHNLDHFAARDHFAAFERKDGEGLLRPLLYVVAPKPCTAKSLGLHLWQELTGYPFHRARPTEQEIWRAVVHQMGGQGVRFLVIDEFHHVIDGNNSRLRNQVTETLKGLSNGGPFTLHREKSAGVAGPRLEPIRPARPLNILLAGMPTIENVVRENAQFDRRKYRIEIKPVATDEKGRKQLDSFLKLLTEKSGLGVELTSGDLPLRLQKAARGYLGMIAYLVKRAGRRALSQGRSTMDPVKDLGGVFEDITGASPERNPFFMPNLSNLARSVSVTEEQMTRLRGKGEAT